MDQEMKEKYVNELNEIIESREPYIEKMYLEVRDILMTPYEWPEMDTLRGEISQCLIFGYYQAAITLTNHMLESLLKFSLSYKYVFDNQEKEPDPDHSIKSLIDKLKPGFDHYDNETLYNTIEEAYKIDLIDESRKKKLHKYRNLLRNAYSHAEKKKIHGDTTIPVQSLYMDDSGEYQIDPESEHKINDLPFIHGIAQIKHAEANATSYFKSVDNLVRELEPMIFPTSQ